MCVIMDIIAKREMANATEDVFLIRRDFEFTEGSSAALAKRGHVLIGALSDWKLA